MIGRVSREHVLFHRIINRANPAWLSYSGRAEHRTLETASSGVITWRQKIFVVTWWK